MKDTFSTTAFRSFKSFVGELTAAAAGNYVGLKEIVPVIDGLDAADPWKSVADKYDIRLSGFTSERVLRSTIRLNLVSLYSGLDLFFLDTRKQFHELHGKDWERKDGDTPFDSLRRNTPSSKSVHEQNLGLDRIATLDYYRLVRNSIAHPSDNAVDMAKSFYSKNQALLDNATKNYKMKSVPSPVDALSFHDVRYLSRIALDVASAVDRDFDPGDERLAALVPAHFQEMPKSEKRRHNAEKGWLSVVYGVNSDRAERILDFKKDSLA